MKKKWIGVRFPDNDIKKFNKKRQAKKFASNVGMWFRGEVQKEQNGQEIIMPIKEIRDEPLIDYKIISSEEY